MCKLVSRNIKEIREIEETYKKTGQKRVSQERRKIHKKNESYCKKFKKDPLRFYTSPLKSCEIQALDLKNKLLLSNNLNYNHKMN